MSRTTTDQEVIAGWNFRQRHKSEMNLDPTEGEFFLEEGLADALVREAGQNTLDAKDSDAEGPAKLRFSFHRGGEALPTEVAGGYLTGLVPHIEAEGVDLVDPPEGYESGMPFLVVEDFNTRGLRGDPAQHTDRSEGEERNDFYYFWRNRGRSKKSDTDRGRWGLGKLVFPASSRINAIFGLTVRPGESVGLLMGEAVLKIHSLEDEDVSYDPFGYFAKFDDDRFAMPVTDHAAVERFETDFRLEREDRPGLSIVIPYVRDELRPRDVARAAAEYYYYPILAGELEVEVEDSRDEEFSLTAETLVEQIEAFDWSESSTSLEELKELIEFAQWALECPGTDRERLRVAGNGNAPNWSDDLFEEGRLESLQKKFAGGERLALRAPVVVKKGGEELESYFDAYLQRDERLDGAVENYVRQGLTISELGFLKGAPVRGLLVVEDPVLSALLGDAENPAHTYWSPRARRVARNYEHGYTTVNHVRRGLEQLVQLLTPPPEGVDEDLLRNIFFVDLDSEGEHHGGADGEEVEDEREEIEDDEADDDEAEDDEDEEDDEEEESAFRKPAVTIEQLPTGFRITRRVDRPVPLYVNVRMAYATSAGNPLKRYSPFDFDLRKDIDIEAYGVRLLVTSENHLRFEVMSLDFGVAVTGFDTNRDLFIRERLESPGAGS